MDGGEIGLSGGALSMADAAAVVGASLLFFLGFNLPIPIFFLFGGKGAILKSSQVKTYSMVSNESKRCLAGLWRLS